MKKMKQLLYSSYYFYSIRNEKLRTYIKNITKTNNSNRLSNVLPKAFRFNLNAGFYLYN